MIKFLCHIPQKIFTPRSSTWNFLPLYPHCSWCVPSLLSPSPFLCSTLLPSISIRPLCPPNFLLLWNFTVSCFMTCRQLRIYAHWKSTHELQLFPFYCKICLCPLSLPVHSSTVTHAHLLDLLLSPLRSCSARTPHTVLVPPPHPLSPASRAHPALFPFTSSPSSPLLSLPKSFHILLKDSQVAPVTSLPLI